MDKSNSIKEVKDLIKRAEEGLFREISGF